MANRHQPQPVSAAQQQRPAPFASQTAPLQVPPVLERGESAAETVYELDINDDYRFYSNPVSQTNSLNDAQGTILPSGGAGGFNNPQGGGGGGKRGGTDGDHERNEKVLPALYDPFVRKQLSQLKSHSPWFLGIVTAAQVAALVASFVINWQRTGSVIQMSPFNYMIGPESGVIWHGLDAAGVRFLCPAGIIGSQVNGTVCTLLDTCSWGGFPTGRPDQWFRFFAPILLHGGVIHLLFNMSFQVQAGFQLEKDMGWWRMALIYIGSGVGGFVFGASLSDVRVPSVGASGSLYGMVACLLLDLIQNWSLIKQPWIELAKMILNIIFSLLLGTLPYIDNLAHVGGFITGLLLGILFMPKIYFGKWDRRRKYALMVAALPSLIVYFALTINSFYDGTNTCGWCKYANCIPGMPWCDQKFNAVTSVTFNTTKSS
ncbi:rhomboid family-domain-containing protein [Entophlyctis helioformis]|nr:rhomboid family-domain-containing protein [Entophlyctis helioformis]